MSLPIEENAGKILSRAEICHSDRAYGNNGLRHLLQEESQIGDTGYKSLFMCVHTRGRWKWLPLSSITNKNYKEYREKITQNIEGTYKYTHICNHNCPIKITGATGSNAQQINGIFYPAHEATNNDGINVYLRDDHNAWQQKRWLYMANNDNGNRSWRIGNTRNMNQRNAIGWLMQTNTDPHATPYELEVNNWKVWSGVDTNGEWINCPSLKIELMRDSRESELIALKTRIEKELLQQAQVTQIKEKYQKVSSILFNKLDKMMKQSLIENVPELRELLKYDKLCAVCLADKPTTPCVHFECPGACDECRSSEDGKQNESICCACGKEQKLQCPVCFDTYSVDQLEIFKCRHCICLRCYLNSYKVNKKIKKCPTCRAKLPKNFVLSES